MIPGKNNTKYKYLPRIRIDVFNDLKTKILRKKKWRQVVRTAKIKKQSPFLQTYSKQSLSKFPNNLRYYYKNTMFIKRGFQLFYGGIQDYKLKAIIRKGYESSPRNTKACIFGELEYRLEYFLYSIGIVGSIAEARHHLRYKRVYVNQSATKKRFGVGDVLQLSESLRRLAERRLFKGPLKSVPSEIDFEAESMRFYILSPKKSFSHPYSSIFRRLSKWYSI